MSLVSRMALSASGGRSQEERVPSPVIATEVSNSASGHCHIKLLDSRIVTNLRSGITRTYSTEICTNFMLRSPHGAKTEDLGQDPHRNREVP